MESSQVSAASMNVGTDKHPANRDVSLVGGERGENGPSEPTDVHRKQERAVRVKTDLTILPLLASVYFLAQMGRSDLGNAKVAGMDKDLSLTPQLYSNIASIFLVGYLVFQLPGTLLLRRVGAPFQFAAAMVVWGVVTACTAKAPNYAVLMGLRSLVGAAEAFIQGAILYLSFWYRYDELATRGAIIFSTTALAGSFNGLLAYAIQTGLEGAGGLRAWQWLFIIEGAAPVAWAFVVAALLPASPEKVRWGFSEAERAVVVRRSRAAHNTGDGSVRPRLVLRLLADPKFWMVAAIDSGASFCVNSLSNFIPDLVRLLVGVDAVRSQLMAVIVYATALVAVLGVARVSDRLLGGKRGLAISACCTVAAVGYGLLLGLGEGRSAAVRLFATCVIAAGAYPVVVLSLVWTASNNIGYTFRAAAAALINVLAQSVSIAGNQAYTDPPLYRKGLASSLGMICMSGTMAALLVLYLKVLNRRKRGNQHTEEAERMRAYSVDEVGNAHPDFFFSY